MGHLGGYRQNPDYAALQVFNQVLSGGFSGRLFQSIRTEKGLAYSVFGDFGCNFFYPGMFFVGLETKTDRTAEAVGAVRRELRRIQQRGVSDEELQQAKDQFLNSLVFRYESPLEVVKRRLYYAYRGMDHNSFEQLIEEIKAVGPKDVHRVAREYIQAEELKVLLVGSEDKLQQQLDSLGPVQELKLRK
jgi:predicted Zn-dependent peptidase